MTDSLESQYIRDWNEWPVEYGAPFYDINGNGVYDPILDPNGNVSFGGDHPGIADADQVLWFVCNDLDPTLSANLYGSPPMGLELQVTMWAYNQPGAGYGQVAFRRYRFINKSGFRIDSMYIAQWSDTDIGNAENDLVGCDSLLDLGYGYNAEAQDPAFLNFGLSPSAFGYSFFYGPIVPGKPGQDLNNNGIDDSFDFAYFNLELIGPGFINLSMTSFGYYSAGNPEWSDPQLQHYNGTLQWFNLLRGFITTTDVNNPTPFTHRNTGVVTKFPLNGDPVTGTGDIDGQGANFAPGNRRMAICSGPFEMMPGDTQEVVVAIVGGNSGPSSSGDAIQSVASLKNNILTILPLPPPPPPILGDTLEVQSIVGTPDNVFPIVVDYSLLTGHTYMITFFGDTLTGDLLWRLTDQTAGVVKLDGFQVVRNPSFHPIVDGIQWQVFSLSPEPGFVNFLVVANAAGPLEPPEMGTFAFNDNGFPWLFNSLYPQGIDRPTERQQVGPGIWGINVGGGANDGTYETFLARALRNDNADRCIPFDFEMRFTSAGGYAVWAFTTETAAPVPFELWNIGIATPDDPSDDYRMIPWVLDEVVENDVYDFGTNSDGTGLDHGVSGGSNDPYTDWFYWRNPENTSPGTAGYDQFVVDALAGTYNYNSPEVMARMVLVNWNGGDVNDPTFPANVNQLLPEEGTIFRILTSKSNSPGDSLFVISPPPVGIAEKNIPAAFYLHQNYPNPFNPETHIQFNLAHRVKVKLEIYNVLGQRVRTLVDSDMAPGKHEMLWDGRNDAGNRVSSGMYFYRLQAGDYVKSRKMILIK
jgi:hypothetical protein